MTKADSSRNQNISKEQKGLLIMHAKHIDSGSLKSWYDAASEDDRHFLKNDLPDIVVKAYIKMNTMDSLMEAAQILFWQKRIFFEDPKNLEKLAEIQSSLEQVADMTVQFGKMDSSYWRQYSFDKGLPNQFTAIHALNWAESELEEAFIIASEIKDKKKEKEVLTKLGTIINLAVNKGSFEFLEFAEKVLRYQYDKWPGDEGKVKILLNATPIIDAYIALDPVRFNRHCYELLDFQCTEALTLETDGIHNDGEIGKQVFLKMDTLIDVYTGLDSGKSLSFAFNKLTSLQQKLPKGNYESFESFNIKMSTLKGNMDYYIELEEKNRQKEQQEKAYMKNASSMIATFLSNRGISSYAESSAGLNQNQGLRHDR